MVNLQWLLGLRFQEIQTSSGGMDKRLMATSAISINTINMSWIGNSGYSCLCCILHCDINLHDIFSMPTFYLSCRFRKSHFSNEHSVPLWILSKMLTDDLHVVYIYGMLITVMRILIYENKKEEQIKQILLSQWTFSKWKKMNLKI